MGAGKKELATSNHGWSSTRNLEKSHLGGVIFGAKNTTINECLSKQLFGLPNQHFVYVGKIDPGLPLFLFNYTDRKLHGIFEAAGHGQKHIDPYSWTSDGLQRTAYPAQVQVRIRSQCQPLTENQFKPIIVDNYYTHNRFWFELDHSQTNKLLSLFSSRSVSATQSILTPHGLTKWSIRLPSVSKSDEKVETKLVQSNGTGASNGVKNALKNEMTNDSSKEVAIHDEKKEDALAKSSEGPMIAKLIEKVEDLMAFKTSQNHKIGCLEMKIVSLEQNLVFIYLVWRRIKRESELFGFAESWDTILMGWSNGRGVKLKLNQKLSIVATVYHIWQERNRRLFNNQQKTVEQIVKAIREVVLRKVAWNIRNRCTERN